MLLFPIFYFNQRTHTYYFRGALKSVKNKPRSLKWCEKVSTNFFLLFGFDTAHARISRRKSTHLFIYLCYFRVVTGPRATRAQHHRPSPTYFEIKGNCLGPRAAQGEQELGCQYRQETYTTMYHWVISFNKIKISNKLIVATEAYWVNS